MADTPIPQQQGLSQEDLDKMKPTEQKYKPVGDSTLAPQLGLLQQKAKLKNLVLKALINYDKNKANANPKDEYAANDNIDKFVQELSNGIASMIKAQNWNVTTNDNTVVTVPAYTGVTNGVGTGIATNTQITTE